MRLARENEHRRSNIRPPFSSLVVFAEHGDSFANRARGRGFWGASGSGDGLEGDGRVHGVTGYEKIFVMAIVKSISGALNTGLLHLILGEPL